MKAYLTAAAAVGALSLAALCQADPPPHVTPPAPDDPKAYQPVPALKQLPSEPPPAPQTAVLPNVPIHNEELFVAAYEKRHHPRIMVFVNRTADGEKQGTPDKYDTIGASSTDYELVEASIVKYFDNSGKVDIQSSDAARRKLDREQVSRIGNDDAAAVALLSSELQQDLLIKVIATPTSHAGEGPAVRLIAKVISTSDARNMGTAFVDMPLPMTTQNINVYTRYLSSELMGEMCKKWTLAEAPMEVRIYKAGGVDDTLKIKKWLQATRGVKGVDLNAATSNSKGAYASLRVTYDGAPEDLYSDLKDEIGASHGLKAVDLQNNLIDLEVTGDMTLTTTTRKVETTTTVTEEKKVDQVSPAPVVPVPVTPPPAPVTPAPGPQL